MRQSTMFALVLAAASTMFTNPATAAIVTLTFDFSATNFTLVPGRSTPSPLPPPFPTVTGSFSFTFDDAGGIPDDTTSGVVINMFNGPLEFPLAVSSSGGTLTFGGLARGVSATEIGTDDLTFVISNAFTPQPRFGLFVYASRLAPLDGYVSLTGCVNGFCVEPSIVPEPASWALMIIGFGIVGAAARRRQPVKVSYA